MEKINSEVKLKEAIDKLKRRLDEEEIILRKQFILTCESMKPANLIKSAFKEVAASSEINKYTLNTSVGLIAGYLSKKIFVNVSHSLLRNFLGIALQFGITNLVSNNPEGVKSVINGLKNFITRKPRQPAS